PAERSAECGGDPAAAAERSRRAHQSAWRRGGRVAAAVARIARRDGPPHTLARFQVVCSARGGWGHPESLHDRVLKDSQILGSGFQVSLRIPRRIAIVTACVRSAAPSLSRMFCTCILTVPLAVPSRSAISLLPSPCETSSSTSVSRRVSATCGKYSLRRT